MSDTLSLDNPLEHVAQGLDRWLVKQPETGRFAIDREVFTDPTLFELEMKYIFERNWVFLGHESQVEKPGDFLTTYIGRQPVILVRNRDGELRCLINACAHRGARVCREKSGNQRHFTCMFHGWVYDGNGKLVDVPDEKGAYAPFFRHEDFGLESVGRLETYRGLVFASLSADVLPLQQYLNGACRFIDLVADQSPEGKLEVLRGATRYTYKGNWKLQIENGLDGYHVVSTHGNYFMTTQRRTTGQSGNDTRVFDFSKWGETQGGSFSFENGHAILWTDYRNFQDRPNFESRETFVKKYGEDIAKWMNGRIRNLMLFPSVFLMDQTSTQLRIVRPIAVDRTEVTTYCIAPVGESARARTVRIRQYEDFFNASGMATPDDLTEFENCQIGFARGPGRLNDMSRGATRAIAGAGPEGAALQLKATAAGTAAADEGLYVGIHENWRQVMKAAGREEMVAAMMKEAAE
jgi:benzoate/toluate 1,2-dioxygenase alpha subunit